MRARGRGTRRAPHEGMQRPVVAVLYVLTMIAVIVGVDVLFLRSRFWMRLIANVGIVLVFAAVYFAFLKRTR